MGGGALLIDVTILDSAEDVAAAAASDIAEALREGARTLVLAGGTTPKRCSPI